MTIGRPLQYDPEKALDAAMNLFWSQGYEATSLQDLLNRMGLSKSSFYQGFGGKKELFVRCMGRYHDKMAGLFAELKRDTDSGRAFVERVLLGAVSETRQPDNLRRGCLLMNTATEFAQKDQAIAVHVTTGFKGLHTVFRNAVLRGQKDGSITAQQDAGVLADYLICSLGGIKAMVKGGANEEKVTEIIGVILKSVA